MSNETGLYMLQKCFSFKNHLSNYGVKPIFFFSVQSLTLMKMDRLTITQRINVIKTYLLQNGDSGTATYGALRGDYGSCISSRLVCEDPFNRVFLLCFAVSRVS